MKIKHEDFKVPFDLLNHTELVWFAEYNGIPNVSRGVPREDIIKALREVKHIPGTKEPFGTRRTRISRWLKRYWDRLSMQAPEKECPECSLCQDATVADCWLKNQDQIT